MASGGRAADRAATGRSGRDDRRWCGYVLARQFTDPDGWELQNMLTVARLMVEAALAREESRGVHLRTDFPADGRRPLAAASWPPSQREQIERAIFARKFVGAFAEPGVSGSA